MQIQLVKDQYQHTLTLVALLVASRQEKRKPGKRSHRVIRQLHRTESVPN